MRKISILLMIPLILAAGCTKDMKTSAGKTAPDFRADDLTGHTHYLNAELQKPVVLIFFATWCVPCREEIPTLIALHEQFGEKVNFLCVVTDPENKDKALSIVNGFSIPYPMLLDTDSTIYNAYTITALPTIMLVGTDGKIRTRYTGFGPGDKESFIAEIKRALES